VEEFVWSKTAVNLHCCPTTLL